MPVWHCGPAGLCVVNGGIKENKIKHSENIKDMLGRHRVFD
jgi:hypothetical protein